MSDASQPALYLAVVHHPVLNRLGEVITTSITNLDLHDPARVARSYGFAGVFMITPIHEQRALVKRILSYWHAGDSARQHPIRAAALQRVSPIASIAAAQQAIASATGQHPQTVGTSAKPGRATTTFAALRWRLTQADTGPPPRPHVVAFWYGLGPMSADAGGM